MEDPEVISDSKSSSLPCNILRELRNIPLLLRIAPPSRQSSFQSSLKSKGKNFKSEQMPPISSESPKKDPKGGSFCQARNHPLSASTPICRTCGPILCNINQPYFACPHCLAWLISENIRDCLVSRIQAQLDQTTAREVAARERAIEEAKQQAGAFPTLYGTIPTAKPIAPQPQTDKVVSLNSKSKKVLLSSYTSTPASSTPASRSETEEEEAAIMRIPSPFTDVNFARGSIDPAPPWANLVNENPEYVSPPSQGEPASRRRRRKGKDRDNGSRAQDDNVTASRP
ncbi:hypothetical protein F5051DRAFT_498528 [Lentinula edodes]|nr:hypothetical protein F5051DRAFT_498528 [Lentinula edodes]